MASTSFDLRQQGPRVPIARKVVDLTLVFGDDDTTIEEDILINGTIMSIDFVVPSLDGTQCTLSIEDEDDDERYDSDLVDQSTTHVNLVPGICVGGTSTVKVVTASAQTANRVFKVKIWYV